MDETMKKQLYSVREYDPEWVPKFENIRFFLKDIFKEKAVAIEHVGSTSVPDMKAKPLIDVLITVEKMEAFGEERRIMIDRGYVSVDNYIAPDSILFYKEEHGAKSENVH